MRIDITPLACILLGLLVWWARADAVGEVERLEIRTPRAFGYTIGDTIEHEIALTLAAPFALDANSLPKPGRVDPWLVLRAPLVQRRRQDYEITLVYQLVASHAEGALVIPGLELAITNGERVLPVFVPEWSFRMTPLVAARDIQEVRVSALRPDRAPAVLGLDAHLRRLGVFAAGLLAAVLYLLYVYQALPWLARRKRPFVAALRALKRLQRQPWDEASRRAALRVLHAAFNETAGRALFAADLESFFRDRPQYAPVRSPAQTLYAQSRALFFGTSGPAGWPSGELSLSWLLELCRRCRDIERSQP